MLNNKIYLLFVIVLLFATCCKDPRPIKPEPDPIYKEYWLGEAKDYMYFKHGTWWVYINIQSGLTDSVYVTLSVLDTSIRTGIYDYSRHRTFKVETCRIASFSSKYNQYYDWYNRGPNPDATNISEPYTVFSRSRSPGGGGGIICLRTPFIETFGNYLDAQYYHLKKDTTMTVQGKFYNKVQKVQINMDYSYPFLLDEDASNHNFYMYVYHAKGYGIIKYEEPMQNKSIELLRSNIVQ